MPGMVLDAALALVPGIPYPDNGPKPIPTGGTVQTPRQTAYAARGAHSGAGDGWEAHRPKPGQIDAPCSRDVAGKWNFAKYT